MTIQVATIIQLVLGVSGDDVRQHYGELKDMIPESIKQQMQGIADGLTQYWHIPENKAWEIVLALELGGDAFTKKQEGSFSLPGDDEQPGCTAFAFHADNQTFLAHNEDQTPTALDIWAISHFIPDTGDNAFISLGVPAGAVSVGMVINEKGIGMTFNVGRPNKNPVAGVPVMHMVREVITKCDTLDEAVSSFTGLLADNGTFSYMGGNIMVVDFNDGTMAWMQVCSSDIKVTYGQELKPGVTYLAFTNHFDDDFSPLSEEDRQTASNISSFERYNRLMEIIPRFEKYGFETCWKILSDHGDGEPNNNTICRKSNSALTVFSNVFTADTSSYTIGVPSEYLALYGKPQELDNRQVIVPSITGTVTAAGKPLAKAKVMLDGVNVQGINLKTRTAEDGSFMFNNLESGTYKLRVKAFPHLPGAATFDYTEGTPQTVNIGLLF
jgi:hypothetical protein